MSKFRHVEVNKEEIPIIKKKHKKIHEELPSHYNRTISLMEKLGIKIINNDNLLKSINLRKSTNLNMKHHKHNLTNINEEEKYDNIIKSSSLQKRKKNINKKEFISSSNEKRIIKKELFKKEVNKIAKIKKYTKDNNNKKENIKKIKKDKDKDNNISLNLSAKKRISSELPKNNISISNKAKNYKRLKSNEIRESKVLNPKKEKLEKFISTEKDNSIKTKSNPLKQGKKPKSDKKIKDENSINNNYEDELKEIEDIFNKQLEKTNTKKIKSKSVQKQNDFNFNFRLSTKNKNLFKRNSSNNNNDSINSNENIDVKIQNKNKEVNYTNKKNYLNLTSKANKTDSNEVNKILNIFDIKKVKSESAEAKRAVRSNKRHATEMMTGNDLNIYQNKSCGKKLSLKNVSQLSNNIDMESIQRRSYGNRTTKEKFENLLNEITLRKNGGNTLYLKNYEKGEVHMGKIEYKIKNENIIKNIKICSCTKPGCSGPGVVKINQDAFFIKDNFLNNENNFFLGVCDGHGEKGQLISQYVSEKLPEYLNNMNYDSIIDTFRKINNEIYENKNIESIMSGTTVSSLILTSDKILSINLGDSRISIFREENGLYTYQNLTRDHKPNEKDENLRIINSNGRIKRCYDEELKKYIGPERVWLKNKEEPGLAMTRSIGDKLAHSIGVIEDPEFKSFEYIGNEKFIIIASDGIWEYLNGDDCIKIVKNYYEKDYSVEEASFALVKEAFNKWKRKEVAIDDITAIVIFFYD